MLFSSSPRVHLLLSSAGSVTIRSLLRVSGRSRSLRRNPFTQLLIDFSCFLVEILELLIASSAAQAHGRVSFFSCVTPLGRATVPYSIFRLQGGFCLLALDHLLNFHLAFLSLG